MDFLQERGDACCEIRSRWKCLFLVSAIATGDGDAAFFQIAQADLHAHGHAFFDPLPALHAAAEVALVHMHAHGLAAEGLFAKFRSERVARGEDGVAHLGLRRDGDDDDLLGRDARREHRAVVIRVRHDDGADEPRAYAPGRGPRILVLVLARDELDLARLRKILPEKVRRAGLDRLPILHHRLDAQRLDRAGETLARAFFTCENRQRQPVAREGLIHAQDQHRLLARLLFRLMRSVAFLPEKFRRAQKNARAHFPSDDVRPLVDQNRQVAIRLHPLRVARADDRLARRTDHKRFRELRCGRGPQAALAVRLQAVMRHHRAFLREAFDVRGLLCEIRERDEEREIRVAVAGRLEHSIQRTLHILPDAIAPRFDHHASAHVGILREVRRTDDLLIPLGKVLFACGGDGCLWLAHVLKK